MAIFKFELKQQIKSCIIWTLSLIGVLLVFLLVIFPVFQNSAGDVKKIYEGFPPEFAAGFGISIDTMFDLSGYYSFSFVYLSLIGGIMAASLGIAAFSREKRVKCTDFLMTKPVSRIEVFVGKFLSGLCILVLTNVLYVFVTMMIGYRNHTDMLLPALSLFLTQLVFLALGILFAVFAKKIRSVSGSATAFGFGAFILSALVNILKEEGLRFFDALKYFDPGYAALNGGYEWKYALTGIAVIIFCITAAYLRFLGSDIKTA